MNHRFRFFRLKLFAGVFAFLALGYSLVVWGGALQQKNFFIRELGLVESNILKMETRLFETTLSGYLSGVAMLADTTGSILKRQTDTVQAYEILTDFFSSYAIHHAIFDQIRFIDSSGMEQVRINWNSERGAWATSQKELQNKGNRSYFIKGMAQSSGAYLSRFDLNVEKGEIELPFKPALRITHRVNRGNGESAGIIVVNLLGEKLLQTLMDAGANSSGRVFLVNNQGHWLIGPSPDLEWQFLFSQSPKTLATEFPRLWQQMVSVSDGHFFSDKGLFYFSTITPISIPDSQTSEQLTVEENWRIINFVSKDKLVPPWWTQARLILAGGIILLAVLAWYLSVLITRRQMALQNLEKKQKELHTITRSVRDAVVMVDDSGKASFWNESAERMFGFSAAEILGRDVHGLITPESLRPDAVKGLKSFAFSGEGPIIGHLREVEALRKDGTCFPAEINLNAVQIDGQWWAVGVVRDISARKAIEEIAAVNEQRFEKAINDAPYPAMIHAEDGEVLLINQPWIELTGYRQGDMKTIEDWAAHAYVENAEQELLKINTLYQIEKRVNTGVSIITTADGRTRDWEISTSPLGKLSDGRRSVISMATDVTERRAAEAQVQALNRELEERVRNRTLRLKELVKSIEKKERVVALLGDVAAMANTADSVDQALQICLKLITGFTGWPVGHVYMTVHSDEISLVSLSLWHVDDPGGRFQNFIDATERTVFKPGEGLPGRVYTSKKATWIEDVTADENFPRARFLSNTCFRGAFALPVRSGMDVVAVLEFFSPEIEAPDQDMLEVADEIGNHLGYVIERKRIEKALQESERKFRGIFNQSFQFMGLISTEGRILKVNETALQMVGMTEDELRGSLFWDSPWWWYSKAVSQKIQKAVGTAANGEFVRFEIPHMDKDGQLYDFDFSLKPIYDSSGNVFWLIPEGRDITDRKVAEAEARKLALVVEKTSTGVVITDRNARIEWFNKGFERISGYCLEEMKGKRPGTVLQGPETNPETVKQISQALKAGQGIRVEILNYNKLGESYWLDLDIQPVFSDAGELFQFIAIETDISERIKNTLELKKAKDAAEQATVSKSEFLANMSHEIRTPMNAIIGMTYLAARTPLTPRQKDYLDKIEISAKSLLGIINDILDFSKIEAGKLTVEQIPFSLSDVLNDIVTLSAPAIAEKGLELHIWIDDKISPMVLGDPVRVGQVLNNLLSNAVKFTEKGYIEISIRLKSQNKAIQEIECTVSDTGIGMNKKQVARMFQKFSQADTAITRKYGGTGLGLAISRQLVRFMGGDISVKSTPEKGSAFVFTLPYLSQAKSIPLKDSNVLPLNLRNLKVLLIDASQKVLDNIGRQLASLTFNVKTCLSCSEGLQALDEAVKDKHPFELIVLDYKSCEARMPPLAAGEIWEALAKFKIPVIIMAGVNEMEHAETAMNELSMVRLLSKPIFPSNLFNTIVDAFGYSNLKTEKRSFYLPESSSNLERFGNARVLLVEDNQLNQQVAKELLEQAGLEVTIVENGLEALEVLNEQKFNLVLMDIQMPVMDGITATEKIRQLDNGAQNLPIIAMTANAMVGDRKKSLDAGMNDHISKPVDPEQLYECLHRWIPRGDVKNIEIKKKLPDDFSLGSYLEEKLPEIDVALGIRQAGSNLKLYRSLLHEFVEQFKDSPVQVRSDLMADDRDKALGLVHTAKGLSATIGASTLHRHFAALERAIQGDEKEVEPKITALESELEKIVSCIVTALASAPESAEDEEKNEGRVISEDEMAENLIALKRLIRANDMDSEDFFKGFETALTRQMPQMARRIGNAIASLDFKKANQIIEKMLNKENRS